MREKSGNLDRRNVPKRSSMKVECTLNQAGNALKRETIRFILTLWLVRDA